MNHARRWVVDSQTGDKSEWERAFKKDAIMYRSSLNHVLREMETGIEARLVMRAIATTA